LFKNIKNMGIILRKKENEKYFFICEYEIKKRGVINKIPSSGCVQKAKEIRKIET